MDCGFYCCRSTTAWRVTVYAVKTSSQSTVKVVSVGDMSGGGGWSDNSLYRKYYFRCIAEYLSGRFTESKENICKEGDTVKVGDDLLTYDMTLENLDLEMKKTGKTGNRTEHRESKKRNYKIKEYKTVQ